MCTAYLEYREPIRMCVAWIARNQFRCRFSGMGTNSDAAVEITDRFVPIIGIRHRVYCVRRTIRYRYLSRNYQTTKMCKIGIIVLLLRINTIRHKRAQLLIRFARLNPGGVHFARAISYNAR